MYDFVGISYVNLLPHTPNRDEKLVEHQIVMAKNL